MWLTSIGVVSLAFAGINLRIWEPKAGLMKTKDAEGKVVTRAIEQADLDIYVCGFMCAPFAPTVTVPIARPMAPRRFSLL